jgi:glyoxylase-like metal-dependent hydrolase (beta-lactamase superfamily II)
MSHETRRIGPFEVTAILDADMPDEPIEEAFPGIPAAALREAKASFPDLYTDDDRWRLRIRTWVVRRDGDVLLLDTGIGDAASPTQEWVSQTGALPTELEELGIAVDDIATVVISHVHDDHIGGLLTGGRDPLCPNARYLVQLADVEWQREAAASDPFAASIWRLLSTVEDAGAMDVIDGDRALSPGLSLRHLPGHTPGHQILMVEDADARMVLSADTWNHPLQLAHPDWPSGPDNDHAAAAAARRTLLADLVAHPGTVVAPTHFAESFGEVRRSGETLTWTAV